MLSIGGWDGTFVRRSLRKFAEGYCCGLAYKILSFAFGEAGCDSSGGGGPEEKGLCGDHQSEELGPRQDISLREPASAGGPRCERTGFCCGCQGVRTRGSDVPLRA